MKSNLFLHIVVDVMLVAVIVCVASVSFLGATANVFSNDDGAPIYRGNSDDKVALMINVYWGTEYLDGFLEIFKKHNVKCTFFVGGCWVAQNPEYLQKIVADGHEVGNHGYFHKQHGKLSYNENVEEIVACSKIVFEYCGIFPKLFAPPSGDFNNETLRAASDNGYKTILWSRDTIDWRDKDSNVVYTRATKQTSGGELILMHPTSHTLQALEKIVQYYIQRNIQPVTVGEILGVKWTSSNNTQAD